MCSSILIIRRFHKGTVDVATRIVLIFNSSYVGKENRPSSQKYIFYLLFLFIFGILKINKCKNNHVSKEKFAPVLRTLFFWIFKGCMPNLIYAQLLSICLFDFCLCCILNCYLYEFINISCSCLFAD